MSAKLQEFEANFEQNLSTKNNQVETELDEWKRNLDQKISKLAQNYEVSRKELEHGYDAEAHHANFAQKEQVKQNIDKWVSRQRQTDRKAARHLENFFIGQPRRRRDFRALYRHGEKFKLR